MKSLSRLLILLLLTFPFVLGACSKDEPEPNPYDNAEIVDRAILVYAVNNSNLSDSFVSDTTEMIRAVRELDSPNIRLLVYCTDSDLSGCTLYEARSGRDGSYSFESVRRYDRSVMSTHPDRVADVCEDVLDLYPNAAYDLIFWGHGTSWKYYDSSHSPLNLPMLYGYGGESNRDYINVDELADAIPDSRFETIWFDCCYMAGIEVIYQFRNKCRTFVGYPTEVWLEGMPYDMTLPFLMKTVPDITGAARTFFDYYNEVRDPVTVTVVDMSKLEPVADAAKAVYASGSVRPQSSSLLNYSRDKLPFYDFRQFVVQTAMLNSDYATATGLTQAFDEALDDAVLYMDASDINFSKWPWDRNLISGINTHFYTGLNSDQDSYYRTLDWFKRVYE